MQAAKRKVKEPKEHLLLLVDQVGRGSTGSVYRLGTKGKPRNTNWVMMGKEIKNREDRA